MISELRYRRRKVDACSDTLTQRSRVARLARGAFGAQVKALIGKDSSLVWAFVTGILFGSKRLPFAAAARVSSGLKLFTAALTTKRLVARLTRDSHHDIDAAGRLYEEPREVS